MGNEFETAIKRFSEARDILEKFLLIIFVIIKDISKYLLLIANYNILFF